MLVCNPKQCHTLKKHDISFGRKIDKDLSLESAAKEILKKSRYDVIEIKFSKNLKRVFSKCSLSHLCEISLKTVWLQNAVTDTQTHKHTDTQTHTQTHRHTHTHRQASSPMLTYSVMK